MADIEKRLWDSFVTVVKGFGRCEKSANYKNLKATLVDSFHLLGCNMNKKLHFPNRYLDAGLVDLSD